MDGWIESIIYNPAELINNVDWMMRMREQEEKCAWMDGMDELFIGGGKWGWDSSNYNKDGNVIVAIVNAWDNKCGIDGK